MSNNLNNKESSDLKKKALLSMLHNKLERQDENFDKEDEIILKRRNVEDDNTDQNENVQIAAESEININPILNREEENENNEKPEEKPEEKAEEVLHTNQAYIIEQNIHMEESNQNVLKESEQEENLEKSSTKMIMYENEIRTRIPFDEPVENMYINANTNISSNTNTDTGTNMDIVSCTPIPPIMMDVDREPPKDDNENITPGNILENKTENVEPIPLHQPADSLKIITPQQDEPKISAETESISNVIQTENLQEEKKPPVALDSISTPIKEEPHQPKKITFMSAKKEVDEFVLFIDKVEQDIKNKYGINLSEFNYEDILPEELKLKLVEDFFNSKEIIDLAKNIK